jgi:hypothetical protein
MCAVLFPPGVNQFTVKYISYIILIGIFFAHFISKLRYLRRAHKRGNSNSRGVN